MHADVFQDSDANNKGLPSVQLGNDFRTDMFVIRAGGRGR